MKKSKFVQGRQGGRYTKWLLFESQLFKFDLYILHFEKGAYVNSHIDECIEGYEHHRVNISWTPQNQMRVIGELRSWLGNRVMYLRPDRDRHYTFPARKAYYMLSIGWLRNQETLENVKEANVSILASFLPPNH